MSMQLFPLLLCLTYLASHKAELCEDYGVDDEKEYVSEGQPVYITCPLNYAQMKNDFNVTWYINGSQTQVSADTQSRIHQNENLIKFLPARLDDTEYYACVLRNSTYCIRQLKKLEVFKNDEGLCYNKDIMFSPEEFTSLSKTINCPYLDDYVDVKNAKIKWFKECQPLDISSDKYFALKNSLTIENVTQQDEGNYTCEVSFQYNATEFTISRATKLSTRVLPLISAPVITYPKNNIFNVQLGSYLSLTCEVLYSGGVVDLVWSYNDTMIDDYYTDSRVVMEYPHYARLPDRHRIATRNLNFSEIKEEDYNRKFFCEVYSPVNPKAYVILKPPDTNLQGFLIAFFVVLVFVIIISIIAIKIFKVDIVLLYRSSCFVQRSIQDGKIYDAYIMFPNMCLLYNMDMFVLKLLPEVLERQCGYRLFIFGRDELPGEAVADFIDEAISQSRRLVIVLGNTSSENRLENDFEQQIAMYDALIRNKIKVILIELEKITDYTNMPESIKYIKQKQGVIRWKGQFTESSLSPKTNFWKNVRYLMPPTQGVYSQDCDHITSEHV
ncbi:interleukin-1 receptor type 1-like isoform X2 [Ascaphus truei]